MPGRGFLRKQRRNNFLGFLRHTRKRRLLKVGTALLLLLGLVLYGSARLRPLVLQMAETEVKNAVTVAVNSAVAEKMASGDLDYSKLIALEKDGNGVVSALVTNMLRINALQAEITGNVIGKIREKESSELGVPLGNVLGGALLSGRGPEIRVRILSVSNARAVFRNSFTTSGINQTRHQILLETSVTVALLAPGTHSKVEVQTEILVAETVIVGNVPESYTYFEGDEKWDENLERFDITT